MSFVDAKDGERRRKSDEDDVPTREVPAAKKKRTPTDDVGRALRSAYEETVGENIPPEMLDLLGKLG